MINRVLIRIKVVQMLYSYLLTRSEFKIASRPETAETSVDKRFAYRTYLDLLLLMLEVSGFDTHLSPTRPTVTPDKKIVSMKTSRALMADNDVRRIIFKESTDIDELRPLAQLLHDEVVESAAYADYKKRRTATLSDEVSFWITMLETVFANNPRLDAAMRGLEGYSKVGYDLGIAMLSDTLRSYWSANAGYSKAVDDLEASLDKAYDLYYAMFLLIVEITREHERRMENAKYKHLATVRDRNPNTRFVDNAFARALEDSPELEKHAKDNGLSWATDIALINHLHDRIVDSDLYRRYMEAPSTDFAADADFWRSALKTLIFSSDELAEALEDKSVYWNDDLQIMGTFVLKTIKQCATAGHGPVPFLPKYKDEEDAQFGAQLFVDSVRNREEYRALIDRFINTGNWDPERQAFMDIVIMITAISELINFPNIPLAVTMNEYIEIANAYSSPKSGQFINGILYNVAGTLRQEGKITK